MADARIRRIGANLCPRCGEAKVVPIAYGMPSSATFQKAERGEVVLGGCCISDDDPVAQCTSCGWQRARKERRGLAGGAGRPGPV